MSTQLKRQDGADDILDRPAYMHQARLLRALHAAAPIEHEDRNRFIHTVTVQQAGGRIEMTVYLTGDATPIDSSKINLTDPAAAGDRGPAV